jgi:hypothetical protein
VTYACCGPNANVVVWRSVLVYLQQHAWGPRCERREIGSRRATAAEPIGSNSGGGQQSSDVRVSIRLKEGYVSETTGSLAASQAARPPAISMRLVMPYWCRMLVAIEER